MRAIQVTAYEVETVEEVHELLDQAGVVGPSLHPRAVGGYDGWNGWNSVITTGRDAEGRFIKVERWHFAVGGRRDISVGINGETPLMSKDAFTQRGVAFPVTLFEPLPAIRHPQWTPTAPTTTERERENHGN